MKVIVVDDEPLARQRLQKMLAEIDGFECVGEAGNGAKAIELINRQQPDIALLDVRMPGIDGLGVAKAISERKTEQPCTVIFTTAYDEYALEAFDVQASGYLLKPISMEKLRKALDKAARVSEAVSLADKRTHLSASSRGKVELIALSDVRILQAEHKYVTVYHVHGESILDESLKMLEEEFPEYFKRVHRNALVSIRHVLALEKNQQGQYELKVADTDVRPLVSRRLATEVRNWMKQL